MYLVIIPSRERPVEMPPYCILKDFIDLPILQLKEGNSDTLYFLLCLIENKDKSFFLPFKWLGGMNACVYIIDFVLIDPTISLLKEEGKEA